MVYTRVCAQWVRGGDGGDAIRHRPCLLRHLTKWRRKSVYAPLLVQSVLHHPSRTSGLDTVQTKVQTGVRAHGTLNLPPIRNSYTETRSCLMHAIKLIISYRSTNSRMHTSIACELSYRAQDCSTDWRRPWLSAAIVVPALVPRLPPVAIHLGLLVFSPVLYVSSTSHPSKFMGIQHIT